MSLVKQWNIGLLSSLFLRPVVLLGVGWRAQAKRKTTRYTKLLLKRVLSHEHIHSVRDSYTERRLKEIGFKNVLNTSCPSMWSLTPEHCREIPAEKGDDVIMTLTDYSQAPQFDRQLIDVLKRSYRNVYLWCQGLGDYAYFTSIAKAEDVEILPSSLRAYDDLLRNRLLSLDYVGTRLHGGIRALQNKRRALIVGVDHRALEKAHDFHLPVLERYIPAAALEQAIHAERPCDVRIPLENIRRWKEQFGRDISQRQS